MRPDPVGIAVGSLAQGKPAGYGEYGHHSRADFAGGTLERPVFHAESLVGPPAQSNEPFDGPDGNVQSV